MFRPPRTSTKRTAFILLGAFPLTSEVSPGQNLTLQVANVEPFALIGVRGDQSILNLGMEKGLKGDVAYGASLNSAYDSNFFLREDNPESEFSTILAPWIKYQSDPEGGAPISLTANYSPVARAYWHNSDFNDVDQSGSGSLTFTGSKSTVSLFARYDELAGTDRLTGEFVNGYVLSAGIQGSHQIAPRTSLLQLRCLTTNPAEWSVRKFIQLK